jgi:threonine dehydratase
VTAQAVSAGIDIEAARRAIGDLVVRTPVLAADGLPADAGGSVVLKAESLQRTGSFKLRGVLSRIAALGDTASAGLVTASAGNHGQAVAYAARARGLRCEVFMPREAPVSKVAAVEALGAAVQLGGDSVDAAIDRALEQAARSGANFVHPYDDPHVVAGQGTVGLELLEDVPDLRRVIVPVGGGGLASGIGLAVKRQRPEAMLVGVQAEVSCAAARALGARGLPPADPGPPASIADGIAIKRAGGITLEILREVVDEMCVVGEDEIAQGMVFLAERAKLVVEGAGAVGVAALLAGRVAPSEGVTAVIVSGGNVDSSLLAALLRRHESEAGRRVRLFTRVPDRPGGLADLLGVVASERANLLAIEHLREGLPLHVRETGVELTLETRGRAHTEQVVRALRDAGYEVQVDFAAGEEPPER